METSRTMVCPSCTQYIMSDAAKCRHCGIPISQNMAEEAAEKETEVIRKHHRQYYWIALVTGSFLFLIGGGLMVAMLAGWIREISGKPLIAFFIGLAELIYAGNGFLDTRRTGKRKKQTQNV